MELKYYQHFSSAMIDRLESIAQRSSRKLHQLVVVVLPTPAGYSGCTGDGLRIRHLHRAHHVVVFVIKNMAVPYVTRARGRVKRECIFTGKQV